MNARRRVACLLILCLLLDLSYAKRGGGGGGRARGSSGARGGGMSRTRPGGGGTYGSHTGVGGGGISGGHNTGGGYSSGGYSNPNFGGDRGGGKQSGGGSWWGGHKSNNDRRYPSSNTHGYSPKYVAFNKENNSSICLQFQVQQRIGHRLSDARLHIQTSNARGSSRLSRRLRRQASHSIRNLADDVEQQTLLLISVLLQSSYKYVNEFLGAQTTINRDRACSNAVSQ